MTSSELKLIFGRYAIANGFQPVKSGWLYLNNSMQVFVFLQLSKVRWGNAFHVWTKIYVDGLFGWGVSDLTTVPSRQPHLFHVEQNKFKDVFDLDNDIVDDDRIKGISEYFSEIQVNYIDKCFSKNGFQLLSTEKKLFVTPPVQQGLIELGLW